MNGPILGKHPFVHLRTTCIMPGKGTCTMHLSHEITNEYNQMLDAPGTGLFLF